MAYYEFTIGTFGNSKDALLNRMSEMGCLGVTDLGEKIIAYFRDTHDIIRLRDQLTSFKKVLRESGLSSDFTFDYLYLSERDWNESWKKRFIPIDVGRNLSILPPWEGAPSGRIPLIIDPGMAFGTGHHETTKTCLMLIEKYVTSTIPSLHFLDVGTGTGILSIAAAKLGFTYVVGVDIDPLAVDAARRNAGLNSLTNIEIREGGISEVKATFDMIAANLMSEVLVLIAPEIASRLNTPGIAILSGMLVGQEDDVINAMEKEGLSLIESVVDDRWISLMLTH